MTDPIAPSPFSPSARRGPAGALLTILAAAAGLIAGRLLGQPGSELLVGLAVGTAVASAITAWMSTAPAAHRLAATGRDAFRVELDRGRRHRRSFAMARLEFRALPAGTAAGTAGDGIAAATIKLIGSSLRITDHVWLEAGDLVILLPESDAATAAAFAERVRTAAPDRFTDRTGIAAFPDDGLTSEALLDALERRLRGSTVPSPIVRTAASRGEEHGLVLAGVVDRGGAPALTDDAVESGVG